MAVDLGEKQKTIGTDHRLPSPAFLTMHFRRNNMP
jgi:hypothetical protein